MKSIILYANPLPFVSCRWPAVGPHHSPCEPRTPCTWSMSVSHRWGSWCWSSPPHAGHTSAAVGLFWAGTCRVKTETDLWYGEKDKVLHCPLARCWPPGWRGKSNYDNKYNINKYTFLFINFYLVTQLTCYWSMSSFFFLFFWNINFQNFLKILFLFFLGNNSGKQ